MLGANKAKVFWFFFSKKNTFFLPFYLPAILAAGA